MMDCGEMLPPILPGNTEDMIVVTSAPNDKLRWEKTHSVNVGLDFAVLIVILFGSEKLRNDYGGSASDTDNE